MPIKMDFSLSVLKSEIESFCFVLFCPLVIRADQLNGLFFCPLEIGDIAGVADVTIRQSYRLIYPRAPDLFPSDFKFDTPVDKLPQL